MSSAVTINEVVGIYVTIVTVLYKLTITKPVRDREKASYFLRILTIEGGIAIIIGCKD